MFRHSFGASSGWFVGRRRSRFVNSLLLGYGICVHIAFSTTTNCHKQPSDYLTIDIAQSRRHFVCVSVTSRWWLSEAGCSHNGPSCFTAKIQSFHTASAPLMPRDTNWRVPSQRFPRHTFIHLQCRKVGEFYNVFGSHARCIAMWTTEPQNVHRPTLP